MPFQDKKSKIHGVRKWNNKFWEIVIRIAELVVFCLVFPFAIGIILLISSLVYDFDSILRHNNYIFIASSILFGLGLKVVISERSKYKETKLPFHDNIVKIAKDIFKEV